MCRLHLRQCWCDGHSAILSLSDNLGNVINHTQCGLQKKKKKKKPPSKHQVHVRKGKEYLRERRNRFAALMATKLQHCNIRDSLWSNGKYICQIAVSVGNMSLGKEVNFSSVNIPKRRSSVELVIRTGYSTEAGRTGNCCETNIQERERCSKMHAMLQ